MPLDIRSPCKRLLTLRTFKLTLHLMQLSVLGACEQGVEAIPALLADVALGAYVSLLVVDQLRGSEEALAADGADLRKLALLRVIVLMVDSQSTEVGEGAPTQLAGERNGHAVMFALMFGQIPRVLEGAVTLRTMKRSLSCVSELMSPDV